MRVGQGNRVETNLHTASRKMKEEREVKKIFLNERVTLEIRGRKNPEVCGFGIISISRGPKQLAT